MFSILTVDCKSISSLIIYNLLFNNIHNIYFFVMVIAIIFYNFYSSSNLKNESLIAPTVSLNLILLFIISIRIGYFAMSLNGNNDGKKTELILSQDSKNETPTKQDNKQPTAQVNEEPNAPVKE